jgi:ABC-2 type transport system permease protein
MTDLAITTRVASRASGLRDGVASEWIKLSSVRSHRWTLAAFVVVTVALGVAISAAGKPVDPTNQSLSGLAFGELAMGVLGVLTITGEYGSGAIRSTLAAVPRRPLVLAAKAIVYATVALAVGEVVTLATFLAGQAAMGHARPASLSAPGVARAVLLSGAFLPLVGLFGLGVGAIVRHSAAAVGLFAAAVLVLPEALSPLGDGIERFAPEMILARSVAAVIPQKGFLSPWAGFGLMAVFAAIALLVGLAVLVRRDA